MTIPELEKLSDAELSARVATEVMGWTPEVSERGVAWWVRDGFKTYTRSTNGTVWPGNWIPSDDCNQSLTLARLWDCSTQMERDYGKPYWFCFSTRDMRADATADSLPRAICLAALLAVQSPNHGFRHLREKAVAK